MRCDDFSFAQRLSIKTDSCGVGTLKSLEDVVRQLREDYFFKITRIKVPTPKDTNPLKSNTVHVYFEEDCTDLQKEWCMEILEWYAPMGINFEEMCEPY